MANTMHTRRLIGMANETLAPVYDVCDGLRAEIGASALGQEGIRRLFKGGIFHALKSSRRHRGCVLHGPLVSWFPDFQFWTPMSFVVRDQLDSHAPAGVSANQP